MVAPMIAHEGVVGVGVLPSDVDILPANNSIQPVSKKEATDNSVKPVASSQTAPFLNNYYSLMEEEEDENQFATLISPNPLAQPQQQQLSQPQTITRTNSQ